MSHGKALIGRRFQNGRARKRSLRFDIPVAKRLADNMSAITQLTPAQLRTAANLKEKITALQKQLDVMLGASVKVTNVAAKPTKNAR